MKRDAFQAIADPTRRAILGHIASQPLNVNTVSENFDMSRMAVYKHLKILTECGLVVIKQHGRERFCEAKLEKLNEVSDWIDQYKKFWNGKFDALENYLEELQANPESKEKKKKSKKHGNKKHK
jgi:DNA-binding transcriptional ArsR family regulator